MDWLKEHRYSKTGRAAWKFTGSDNWYDWLIGTPEHLMNILICIEDKLTAEEIKGYCEYFDEILPKPGSSGANFCHESELIVGSAALQNNYERAIEILSALQKEYLYVDDNERKNDNK